MIRQEIGFEIAHYHFPFLKSLELDNLLKIFRRYELLIVVEEHWPIGGLFSRLLELDIPRMCNTRIERVGPQHFFIEKHLEHDRIQEILGYGPNSLKNHVIKYI
jgi:1-deoxy-D-xylulose-5-phosphate synthase